MLMVGSTLVAALGFTNKPNTRILSIDQIQGKLGQIGAIKGIRWEKLLIATLVHWGQQNNITEIRVINADQQKYCQRR